MIVMPKADYPYRVHVDKETAGDIAYNAAMSVSYGNFKNEVAKHDKKRAGIYHDVWDVMLKLENDDLPGRNNPYTWHWEEDQVEISPEDEAEFERWMEEGENAGQFWTYGD
jgi:hypothetical protein